MKTKKTFALRITLCYAFVFAALTACENKNILPVQPTTAADASIMKMDVVKTNDALHLFAKTLAAALDNNKAMRNFVKTQAENRFDGDYDVFYQNAKTMTVGERTFEDIMTTQTEAAQSLQNIGAIVPLLNISVPVLIEQWDADNYVPLVAVLPAGFKETTPTITAYNAKGEPVQISSITDPKQPVVVVGLSERMKIENGKIVDYYQKNNTTAPNANPKNPTLGTEAPCHTNGQMEKMKAINICKLSSIESWAAGAPELYLKVFARNALDQSIDAIINLDGKKWEPQKRSDIDRKFWSVPSSDQNLFTWQTYDFNLPASSFKYEPTVVYCWFEEDPTIYARTFFTHTENSNMIFNFNIDAQDVFFASVVVNMYDDVCNTSYPLGSGSNTLNNQAYPTCFPLAIYANSFYTSSPACPNTAPVWSQNDFPVHFKSSK